MAQIHQPPQPFFCQLIGLYLFEYRYAFRWFEQDGLPLVLGSTVPRWVKKDALFSVIMVRYVAAATSSWLLATVSLALASTSSHHGAWAIDVDTSNGEDLVGGDNAGDGVVSIEPNNAVDNADGSVWSLPEAIVKATGMEPIAEWKEYLLKDPFGEQASASVPDKPASIYPDKPLSRPELNRGGGSKWSTFTTCPYGGSMDVDYYGKEKCISVGEAICKNGWRFGIRHDIDNTYLMLWREDDPAYSVHRWFVVGATSLCIGEQYPNVAYMRIVFERYAYYLIGPSAGSADHLARLKIVPDTQKYKPDDVIVKFRDGPGDQNALWQIFANGVSQTSPDALWYPILDPIESRSPTPVPSPFPSVPPSVSAGPTVSSMPSVPFMPSSEPSVMPSGIPR